MIEPLGFVTGDSMNFLISLSIFILFSVPQFSLGAVFYPKKHSEIRYLCTSHFTSPTSQDQCGDLLQSHQMDLKTWELLDHANFVGFSEDAKFEILKKISQIPNRVRTPIYYNFLLSFTSEHTFLEAIQATPNLYGFSKTQIQRLLKKIVETSQTQNERLSLLKKLSKSEMEPI